MKLTAKQVENCKPAEKAYKVSDGGGLYLLVNPNGARYWRLKYRFAGKEKTLAIGVFPAVSLAQARHGRDEAKRNLLAGLDPSGLKQQEKEARKTSSDYNFESIAREWYARRFDRWSESYRTEMMKTFEKDVFPYIGHRPIHEIKAPEFLAVLTRLESRGANEKVRKVRQRCGEVWRYAIVTGRAEYNPAPDLASAFPPYQKTHYPHLKEDELPAFMAEIKGCSGSYLVKFALKLLILTGVRPGEIRFAEWSEFDFDKGIWEISAEKMKMRRPHVVPLSRQALEILEEIRPISGRCKFLFPGRVQNTKPISDMAINNLIKRIGYNGRATGHGFRHTASTILHERGYDSVWIELQLAHVDKNNVRGIYNHALYLDGRREMMQWYSDFISSM